MKKFMVLDRYYDTRYFKYKVVLQDMSTLEVKLLDKESVNEDDVINIDFREYLLSRIHERMFERSICIFHSKYYSIFYDSEDTYCSIKVHNLPKDKGIIIPIYLTNIESSYFNEFDEDNIYYDNIIQPIGKLNTLDYLFFRNKNLKYVDLGNLKTENTTSTLNMFYGCISIKELTIDFTVNSIDDMTQMFLGCYNLEKVDFKSTDMFKVTNMLGLFFDCHSLKEIDLSSMSLTNIRTMRMMFYNCVKLERIILSHKGISLQVLDLGSMCYNCLSLRKLDLSCIESETLRTIKTSKMLEQCIMLDNIYLRSGEKRLLKSMKVDSGITIGDKMIKWI